MSEQQLSQLSKDATVNIQVALLQADADIKTAKELYETAIQRVESAVRDAKRDLESGSFYGSAYIQHKGSELDAASARLAAAVQAKKLLENAVKNLGVEPFQF